MCCLKAKCTYRTLLYDKILNSVIKSYLSIALFSSLMFIETMLFQHTKDQKFPKAAIEYKDGSDKENVKKKSFFNFLFTFNNIIQNIVNKNINN